jgi:hypothetical protein
MILKSAAMAAIFGFLLIGFLFNSNDDKEPERVIVCLYKIKQDTFKPTNYCGPVLVKRGDYLIVGTGSIGTTTTIKSFYNADYSKKIKCQEVLNNYNWRELVEKPNEDEVWEKLR